MGPNMRLGKDVVLFDSYHCSRYNTNTGRLTPEMFAAVVGSIKTHLSAHLSAPLSQRPTPR